MLWLDDWRRAYLCCKTLFPFPVYFRRPCRCRQCWLYSDPCCDKTQYIDKSFVYPITVFSGSSCESENLDKYWQLARLAVASKENPPTEMASQSQLSVEAAPPNSPVGIPLLAISYGCALVAIVLTPEENASMASGLACLVTTCLAVFYKLKLNPASIYFLALSCVVLNTFTCGLVFPFKYAVLTSPIVSLAQAFLTLPFALRTSNVWFEVLCVIEAKLNSKKHELMFIINRHNTKRYTLPGSQNNNSAQMTPVGFIF